MRGEPDENKPRFTLVIRPYFLRFTGGKPPSSVMSTCVRVGVLTLPVYHGLRVPVRGRRLTRSPLLEVRLLNPQTSKTKLWSVCGLFFFVAFVCVCATKQILETSSVVSMRNEECLFPTVVF